MNLRLGDLLVERNTLTQEQVDAVLEAQRECGRPFGVLCEQLYDIDPREIEQVWAQQYAGLTRTVDPAVEVIDPDCLTLLSKRQAWQFCVLAMRFDGAELMLATTPSHVARALRFATNVLCVPSYLVVAQPLSLGRALCKHYPMVGMTAQSICDGTLEQIHTRLCRSAGWCKAA